MKIAVYASLIVFFSFTGFSAYHATDLSPRKKVRKALKNHILAAKKKGIHHGLAQAAIEESMIPFTGNFLVACTPYIPAYFWGKQARKNYKKETNRKFTMSNSMRMKRAMSSKKSGVREKIANSYDYSKWITKNIIGATSSIITTGIFLYSITASS